MRYVWILLLAGFVAGGCSLDGFNEKKARSVRQKEQELRKREQRRQEKTAGVRLAGRVADSSRTLRYLYFSDGRGARIGMIGYFSDGTVSACPDCDFSRANIKVMSANVPYASYTVQPDGSLRLDNAQRWVPDRGKDKGWVLIDYKWYVPIPEPQGAASQAN